MDGPRMMQFMFAAPSGSQHFSPFIKIEGQEGKTVGEEERQFQRSLEGPGLSDASSPHRL